MKRLTLLMAILTFACKQQSQKTAKVENKEQAPTECITLLGDTLNAPPIKSGKAKENFEFAKKDYEKYPDSADALIWYGRRIAYLGHFQKAIKIYSEGIEKFPDDARMYRHRGHRYISTRQFDKAIIDFEKAAKLVKGKTDEVEPDGLPNDRNIPLSTLKGNIWYHLGLAHYLNGNFEKALDAYEKREVTNRYDDNLASGNYWLYMIHNRLGNHEKANNVFDAIKPDMDIIENTSYHTMCLFYKGLLSEEAIQIESAGTSNNDVYLYALGNWHLYKTKDTAKTKQLYDKLLKEGNPYSFAYLAAEADWKQLFDK